LFETRATVGGCRLISPAELIEVPSVEVIGTSFWELRFILVKKSFSRMSF